MDPVIGRSAHRVIWRLCPEMLLRSRTISVGEISCGHALLAFGLNFQQLKHGVFPTADKKPRTAHKQTALGECPEKRFICHDGDVFLGVL